MKKIDKGEAPSFFSQYLKQNKPKQWSQIDSIRLKLRAYILEEQGYICAYTEIRLIDDSNIHIDHYKKRALFPQLTFDYKNLLVACNSDSYGAKHKDKLISNAEEYNNLINPVEESSSDYLEFTITGKVETKNDNEKGQQTINYFNLNERSLKERRKNAALFLTEDVINSFTEDEVVSFIGDFESMLRQLYREMK